MTLPLDADHLLHPGIHEATIQEVEEVFGGFQGTDQRPKLVAKLAEYVAALRSAGFSGCLIVDGSFVMASVDEPEDVDLILVLPANWDLTADLKLFQYNLISKRDIKRRFPFDVITVREGSIEEARWTDFFGKVGIKWYDRCNLPEGRRKGLVRIAL
jgi:hypothetical protein